MSLPDLIFFYMDYCEHCENAFSEFYKFCRERKLDFDVVFCSMVEGKICIINDDGKLLDANLPAVPAVFNRATGKLYIGESLTDLLRLDL